MEQSIVVYENGDNLRLRVKTDGETVWLTQEQMCQLFGLNQSVIARHIANIFKEGELPKEGFMQILHYNLDVVISVGYRVKSIQGTRFRQWATRMLREMLLKRVDEVREIAKLRRRMDAAEGDIKQIKGGMSYLVKQLSAPETPRRKVGFGAKPGETSATPYGRAK